MSGTNLFGYNVITWFGTFKAAYTCRHCVDLLRLCISSEELQAGVNKGLTVIGVDTRNEMVQSCNRALY